MQKKAHKQVERQKLKDTRCMERVNTFAFSHFINGYADCAHAFTRDYTQPPIQFFSILFLDLLYLIVKR